LLDFVRSGKGIAGIHAATDSYHGSGPSCPSGAPAAGASAAGAPAGRGGGFGGRGPGATLSGAIFADADANKDQKLTRAELTTMADAWYDKLDSEKKGSVAQADFATRLAAVMPAPQRGRANAAAAEDAAPAQPGGNPYWPEWNKIIGGYFKFHWVDPQEI